jgi:hypothetical protein
LGQFTYIWKAISILCNNLRVIVDQDASETPYAKVEPGFDQAAGIT